MVASVHGMNKSVHIPSFSQRMNFGGQLAPNASNDGGMKDIHHVLECLE
jgi:hypothetical protein